MILTKVVQDDTIGVPGFEHQTFMCSKCHDLERRFVFTKQDRDDDGEPMPEQASPSVALHQRCMRSTLRFMSTTSCSVRNDRACNAPSDLAGTPIIRIRKF